MAAKAPPNGSAGGYAYQFVEPPLDTLVCTICLLPSKEPYLTACCGHTFCKSCLENSKKFTSMCPNCRSEEFTTMFNKQNDRIIRSLHIFCTNKEQRCEWQGEVNDITDHLSNCLFQVIHCPIQCGECLQRQHLNSHVETECPLRIVTCQYCNLVGKYQFIEGQHKEECLKFPVQCPNECQIESVCRDKVGEHREVCPLEMIQCDYHVVGCKVKMARKDMKTHKQEMMEVHLSLTINELRKTKIQMKISQDNLKCDVQKIKDDLTQQPVWHTTKIAYTEQQLMTNQQEVKKTKDELTQRIVLVENQSSSTNEQVAVMKQTVSTQLENLRQQLSGSQQQVKKVKQDLTEQLICTEKSLADKMKAFQLEAKMVQEDLTQQIIRTENVTAKLRATQQEAEGSMDQLLQKLTVTERDLNTTRHKLTATVPELNTTDEKLIATKEELNTIKQQLAVTSQNLVRVEEEHATLAANTNKALTEIESKFHDKLTAAEKKITELQATIQQKVQLIEQVFSPWFISLHDQATKLSSGDQVVPVVVRMTKFTEKEKWVSKPFYDTHNKQCKLQLKVTRYTKDTDNYISVFLLGDRTVHDKHMPPEEQPANTFMSSWFSSKSPRKEFEVKVFNQVTNTEHLKRYLCRNQPADSGFSSNTLYYNQTLISYSSLKAITATCQYLSHDTIFFEVGMVEP